jgi:hypothetical protein
MKKITCLASALTFLCTTAFSQTSTERIVIKGGSSAWDNFMKEVYRYPKFDEGIVEYKDGKRYKSNMNYNKVTGTIQFIDEKGDTLSLANEETVNSVAIGNDVFVYAPQCLVSVKTDSKVKLYKNERARIADNMKTGAYDIPNTGGTIDAINHTDSWLTKNMLDINESLLISKVTTYYIVNDRSEFSPASRKNVLNMFARHEDEVKQFIKSNGIDFNNQQDLEELTGYLSKL